MALELASIPHQGALASAIVGHLVGDYLLQTDYIANNKKESFDICFFHCAIWTACVLLFSGWGYHSSALDFIFLWFALLIPHLIQDHTGIVVWWMRLKWKDQTKFSEPPLGPWSIIVVDNVLHILAIWLVWKFVV